MITITRRRALAGSAALAAPAIVDSRRAAAQAAPLQVLGHRVHQTVATGSQGGDVTALWSRSSGVAVQWTTFDTGPLWERLQRESSLERGSIDIGFLLNTQASPRARALFEPLDAYLQRDPPEDVPDIFPGLLSGMKVGSDTLALPFRHASSGMHYNVEILGERGITRPPKTIEEMADYAKRCVYRRADGTPVVGMVMGGLDYANVIDVARAWDGEIITLDYQCVADQPPMLNAIRLLRDLYVAGAFPRNIATMQTEDVNTWMQQGRAAMCGGSLGRNRIYNDPARSKFPGKIVTQGAPISETLRDRYEVAPGKVEFWGLAIPKNAPRKDLSWSFIKSMLSKQSTLMAALNGNGPVRNSTYEDAKFRESVPYADEERRVLRVSRIPMPAFDEAPRAAGIIREECEAAVLGMKTPEVAMASLVARVTPLLPRS
jgi:multiple sugar transport system substrate-binding protein